MAVQNATQAPEYHERADEDLVSSAKAGDNLAMEFLLNKYKNFVRIKAKSYFLIGADQEVALGFDSDEVLVLVEQELHRQVVARLGGGYQVLVGPLVILGGLGCVLNRHRSVSLLDKRLGLNGWPE